MTLSPTTSHVRILPRNGIHSGHVLPVVRVETFESSITGNPIQVVVVEAFGVERRYSLREVEAVQP